MRTVFYRQGQIKFSNNVNSYCIRDFCSAINLALKHGDNPILLDFTNTDRAYPNGMVPIISAIESIRTRNIEIQLSLPKNHNVRRLFRSVNWAHLITPNEIAPSESVHDRHLVTRSFVTAEDQKRVVDDFMDVVLRSIRTPRPIFSGLEWTVNEITDNVLNHSDSKTGGIIQASTYPSNGLIAFAVADSGRGILNSLQEGLPSLRTDSQAIGEAIKAGVTRNPKYGQGNGLAGAVRISTLSGGSFELTSGRARLLVTPSESKRIERKYYEAYAGTVVCGQIKTSETFSIQEALTFGDVPYAPVDFIEMNYERNESSCHAIALKSESTGYGTRQAGRQLRNKALNLLEADKTLPLVIDWSGIPVISSSFADEFIGKLFAELGALTFSARIRNRGMEQLIASLLDKAIAQRLTQERDAEE
jgi:hypothetical protein